MFFHTLRIHQNVVNEYHDKLVQLWHEAEYIRYMMCADAFINPNDIIRYS
jgi:hypothetical protein